MTKVFELKPHLDKLFTSSGTKVESLESCEDTLYVGISDGHLRQYVVQGDSLILDSEKRIAENMPINYIRAASALKKLLVLVDTTLMVLNLPIIDNTSGKSLKMKGISCISINETPKYDDPFAIQICASKKKQLIITKITKDNISIEKTKDLPEPITALAMDGVYVCAALSSKYVIYNIETSELQEIFSFGSDVFPCISRISKEEFLLNAQNGLGVCANAEGIAKRPPIQWLSPVNKFIHFDSYIITLSPELISVYSLLDYDQKQVISFSGGRLIGNLDGQIFLTSSSSIYQLHQIPIEKNIEILLDNEYAEGALDLLKNESVRRRIDENFESLVRITKIRAGFIFFKKTELEEAKNMFLGAELDPRELISLYPGLLPENSRFVREIPPFHNIADVNQIVRGDKVKIELLKDFLRDFLEEIHEAKAFPSEECKNESNLALLKLLTQNESCRDKLVQFVSAPNTLLKADETKQLLTESGRIHALACLYKRNGSIGEALKLWASLIQTNLKDESFPGFEYFIQELQGVSDEHLWNYADFALAKDPKAMVGIFKHKSLNEEIDDEKVLNFLNKYPEAHLIFLEYLVLEKMVKLESLHSQLAVRYLELIDGKTTEREDILDKFRCLVMTSSSINPKFLLSHLEKTDLHKERAILFGKMGEHEKALQIFVQKLEDYEGAETYCDDMADTSPNGSSVRRRLLSSLLKIYIDGSNNGELSESISITLVNRRSHEMYPVELLKALPPSWSVDLVNAALRKTLRSTTHEKRMGNIRAGLSRGENVEIKFRLLQLLHRPICLEENAHCVVCKKSFHGSSSFTRYPNGVIVHEHCIKSENVCPLTGEIFG